MSAIVCAISGQQPEQPVFSSKTGHVYEKRLIEKTIDSDGKCPVTKAELTKDDLTDVHASKAARPRPAGAASIPGMLTLFQGEWDALMTETYELKSSLDTTRKQLAHALYQHDAACRVIARLLRERDATRAQVQLLQDQLGSSRYVQSGVTIENVIEEPEIGFTPEISERMVQCAQALSKTRKKREFPELTPVAEVQKFTCKITQSEHQSSAPGISCVDLHQNNVNFATGGLDGQVILYDLSKEKATQKLRGHEKQVTQVLLHPALDAVLSSSLDKSARVWVNNGGNYNCTHVVRKHTAAVTDISLHPLGEYFTTSSRDKSWALHDLASGRVVRHVKDQVAGYGCMKFHPDGLILAGASEDKTVNIWDVKEQKIVANLEGHSGAVETLSFSANGYYLVTGSQDGVVKLWDLRKTTANIQTLEVEGPVNAVRFDQTGQYLAVGTKVVSVFNFETKSSLASTCEMKDHSDLVMGLAWGQNANSLVSVSMDNSARVYRGR